MVVKFVSSLLEIPSSVLVHNAKSKGEYGNILLKIININLTCYLNSHFFEILRIGRKGEDMNMKPKEICEVLSNNKGYYKEIFDYYIFAKNKIIAFRQHQNPNYKKEKMNESLKTLWGKFAI